MVRIPSYRRHKPTGQARVTLGGKDFYLGRYGTRESKEAYQRLIGEYVASQGRPPAPEQVTLVELTAAYKRFAKSYYVGPDGKSTAWYAFISDVMQRLGTSAYGRKPASQFGPLALKAYRETLVADGTGRVTVNKKIDIVKRAFKWAAGEEMIAAEVYHALRVVEGLKRGKTSAKESKPVLPVDDRIVELTLPHLPEIVADMVRLQRLTGMRPAEVCILRPCDIDTSEEVWTYRPAHHKTEHHGRERAVFFGPLSQTLLRPYLLRDKAAYCFVPSESEKRRRLAMHEARKTPVGYGNTIGTNRKRKPQWRAGDRYDTNSYRRAISRACEAAFEMPDDLNDDGRRDWRAKHVWAPNQLRHAAATEIRKRFGIEAARVALGHSELSTTQIYAERDLSRAAEVARMVS